MCNKQNVIIISKVSRKTLVVAGFISEFCSRGGQMLRVQILEGASINITTYFKEHQMKFLGGGGQTNS